MPCDMRPVIHPACRVPPDQHLLWFCVRGFIGLRLEKCRHEQTLSIRAAYETAVQTRVMRKQAERRKGKPCPARRSRL